MRRLSSHFSVNLALDDDGDPIARREFSENFFELLCYAAARMQWHNTALRYSQVKE
jgi:hypothetical protein